MPLSVSVRDLNFTVVAEPLTPAAFRPFGDVVQNPRPDILPSPSHTTESLRAAISPPLAHPPVVANQGTAIKYPQVSQPRDLYAQARSRRPSLPQTSIFQCAARRLSGPAGNQFPVAVLERHPFTTQMFCPLGADDAAASARYLVVVAPSGPPGEADAGLPVPQDGEGLPGRGLPDVQRLKAFVATGAQAVTYSAGTWHAPMVALGREGTALDFVVTQFANGVGDEDCQEVVFDGRGRGAVVVEVPRALTGQIALGPRL
ncbi:uncharacterized protein E0L32_007085 [Thyridium curvatum]|uniref:Ureidoglycolate hydrolase n=1 Tax=Thyridium curvatum TaxID=1093900 RepID=A0A507B4D1_9PEZI|nr:uncharacterized protein E0L32_007085 [Thyridium curvatum]TPX12199.1 hypothetical protein E0L32_007085 [Thyridium curvatum]